MPPIKLGGAAKRIGQKEDGLNAKVDELGPFSKQNRAGRTTSEIFPG
jgi:hypothetical protein